MTNYITPEEIVDGIESLSTFKYTDYPNGKDSRLESLPHLDILSTFDRTPHLSDADIDSQLPIHTNFDYYSTREFQTCLEIQNLKMNNSISFMHGNIRSIAANYDKLSVMLDELQFPFSIIGLSETKIKTDKDCFVNVDLTGYNFVSQPTPTNAGGVGFYIMETINYNIRDDLGVSKNEFQGLWVDIEILNQKLTCGVLYRHPRVNLEAFTNYLYSYLDKIQQENKTCVILGDFNINLLNYSAHTPTEDFVNTLSSYFYTPHIHKPTRITNHTATLIDNIFLNSIKYHTISGNILSDISDHLPNFLIINQLNALPKKFKIYKRDYSNLDETALIDEIQSVNWETIFPHDCDVNIIFDRFYSTIADIIDKHVPVKKLSKKQIKFYSKPWITPGIKTSIKTKNKLFKKYLNNKSPDYSHNYKLYRNKLTNLLRVSKEKYFNSYFLKHIQKLINNS